MQIEEAKKILDDMRTWDCTLLNELEKKEKVIDVMAEWINKQDIDEEICKNNITQPELCNEYGTNCRQCIKEYFYKRASDNK